MRRAKQSRVLSPDPVSVASRWEFQQLREYRSESNPHVNRYFT
jgi:hypothetical protein